MNRFIIISALLCLSACEDDCHQAMKNVVDYQSAFDHCMDKAALISKSGTHDNSYNTIEECESYAFTVERAQCLEKSHVK